MLADIPGLIEGAHEGRGLGDAFLGHVERCAVLLHLVDGTSETLAEDYRVIVRELEAYGAGLAEKPRLLGLNKIDALDAEAADAAAAALAGRAGCRCSGCRAPPARACPRCCARFAPRSRRRAAAEAPGGGRPWRP